MKKLFYSGLAGLVVFEILKVYFIMPMPGSQRMNSLDVAYFLHTWRWAFRGLAIVAIVAGARAAFGVRRKWVPGLVTLAALALVWFMNFQMAADSMFKIPASPVYKARADNAVDESAVIVGVEHHGEAKAYPIRFLVYHHQVQDTVGGKAVLVTYCSVCRTGRVFEPLVNGQPEKFRLVGMDHFNAMFEDSTTGSWWRQATGEAVTGSLKGARLPDVASSQMTLHRWFELHPTSVVLQADETAKENFDPIGKFERGKSTGDLTRTDEKSWEEKSWVLGVEAGKASKAYDWNRLKKQRVINDEVGGQAIVLALAIDRKSFVGFERPAGATFALEGDVLVASGKRYDFSGRNLADPVERLKAINASQEFWHSWRTFHPATLRGE